MEKNLKQHKTNIIKIAVFGPESTGKTTLAKQLAKHFNTVWTPEFARDYLQEKWNAKQEICQPDDLIPIANGQIALENELLLKANKYLFCDTNIMVTKVFSEIYYNFCDPVINKAAKNHHYDLLFLTDVDVPWKKDDLRDKPDERKATFEIFKKALIVNKKLFITLSGNENDRLKQAIICIEDLEKAKNLGFSSKDFFQIYDHNIAIENVENQLQLFQKGISKIILDRPATYSDGILKLSDEEFKSKADFFDSNKQNLNLQKFVPASGAASRMFQFLNEFLNEFQIEEESINDYINRKKATSLSVFLAGLEKFSFYDEVHLALQNQFADYAIWNKDLKNYYFIKMLLSAKNFDFANKPKGILPFHKHQNQGVTAVEEHLNESVLYASAKGVSNLHFTVSQQHQIAFEAIVNEVKNKIETESESKITVSYSYQNKATDTIAVDSNNKPFRNEFDNLVFRPGGHGALIENLNALNGDIIFIKNIDNVIQNNLATIAFYKKALAGILIELQQQIFLYLKAIDNGKINTENCAEIIIFITDKLNLYLAEEFNKYSLENKILCLQEALNRPIRVCGMVKNEGEPGGGPFWVLHKKGNPSLQIIESSQIDLDNKDQLKILNRATHFNPVDLVCGIKNYKGDTFDLKNFIDENAGFIVEKNKNGKFLKGYELPGLWNGAMAKWITVFVEVPLITFNPVKTVNDLLKPAHQSQ